MILADLRSDGVRVVVVDGACTSVEEEVARVTGAPIQHPYTKERLATFGAWEGCFVITCTFTR